ncbi:MAG: hypothetical protein QW735_01320 [archaeon]
MDKFLEYVELIFSGIPGVDFYYSITGKHTAWERKNAPEFCKRPKKDVLIANLEHLLYFFIPFLGVKLIGEIIWIIGGLAILVITPLEFVYFRKKVKLFKNWDWKKVTIICLWNIMNAGIYWILGGILGGLYV